MWQLLYFDIYDIWSKKKIDNEFWHHFLLLESLHERNCAFGAGLQKRTYIIYTIYDKRKCKEFTCSPKIYTV
jgi:hypothetical protein